jgi:hypothetical protein
MDFGIELNWGASFFTITGYGGRSSMASNAIKGMPVFALFVVRRKWSSVQCVATDHRSTCHKVFSSLLVYAFNLQILSKFIV